MMVYQNQNKLLGESRQIQKLGIWKLKQSHKREGIQLSHLRGVLVG